MNKIKQVWEKPNIFEMQFFYIKTLQPLIFYFQQNFNLKDNVKLGENNTMKTNNQQQHDEN